MTAPSACSAGTAYRPSFAQPLTRGHCTRSISQPLITSRTPSHHWRGSVLRQMTSERWSLLNLPPPSVLQMSECDIAVINVVLHLHFNSPLKLDPNICSCTWRYLGYKENTARCAVQTSTRGGRPLYFLRGWHEERDPHVPQTPCVGVLRSSGGRHGESGDQRCGRGQGSASHQQRAWRYR